MTTLPGFLDAPTTLPGAHPVALYAPTVARTDDTRTPPDLTRADTIRRDLAAARARVDDLVAARTEEMWRLLRSEGLSLRAVGAAFDVTEGTVRAATRVLAARDHP